MFEDSYKTPKFVDGVVIVFVLTGVLPFAQMGWENRILIEQVFAAAAFAVEGAAYGFICWIVMRLLLELRQEVNRLVRTKPNSTR